MQKTNILVISASPRSGSNSALAATYLISKVNQIVEMVAINNLKIQPCNACDKCKVTLKCVFNDEADTLIESVEKADIVIVATPIYFTGVPGALKNFIDRNQVQWYKKIKDGNKKGIIILTQGDVKDKYFKPAESEIRSFFAVNNIKTVAVLKFKDMDEEGKIFKDKKALNRLNKVRHLLLK
ncbi:MAG: flavodoxin family protein [bacterium]